MALFKSKRKAGRRVIACLSDTHCGHRLGLLNPETVLWQEDEKGDICEYRPELGPMQQYLWPLYQQHIEKVAQIADGAEVVLLVNGDLTQGTRYIEGCFAVTLFDQVQTAVYALKPWFEHEGLRLGPVRIIRGTPSHTQDGSSESMIAALLAERYPRQDVQAYHHGLIKIGGLGFDVAHHGPGGGIRIWTKGNVARHYLTSLILSEITANRMPPRVVLRSHFHRFVWETIRRWGLVADLIVTPSYCGMNGHGRQVTRSVHTQQHGLVAFEVEGGQVHITPLVEELDLRTCEEL